MPPTGRVLLDTNILIALLGGEPAVLRRVEEAEAVYVPVIALGELYYGAQKSARPAENLERLEVLATTAAVLTCDADTAAKYGQLKAELRARGTPIPENDLWVAALARQHSLTLVSRDLHFTAPPCQGSLSKTGAAEARPHPRRSAARVRAGASVLHSPSRPRAAS